jgi:protein SCO1
MKITRGISLAIVSLLLIGSVAVAGNFALRNTGNIPAELRGIALAEPLLLDRREFRSARGKIVFPMIGRTKWTFLSVGYAHCPDICPFILGNLAEVEAQMKRALPDGILPRFVFLSVDPQRDSPEFLEDYAKYFSDRLIGLTGNGSTIDDFIQQIGGFYRIGKADADGFYPVDHSAEIFLIDPRGRLFAKFEPPLDPVTTTERFRMAIDFYQASQR